MKRHFLLAHFLFAKKTERESLLFVQINLTSLCLLCSRDGLCPCQIRDGISQRTFSWGKLFLWGKKEGNFLTGHFSGRLRAPLSVLHQTFLKESRRMRTITNPSEAAWRVSRLQYFKAGIFFYGFALIHLVLPRDPMTSEIFFLKPLNQMMNGIF